MNLFENEIVNIKRIHTVNKYDSENELSGNTSKSYDVNLSTYELIFYLSGEGITYFSGKKIHDIPNSIRYLPKGITEGEYYVKEISKNVCIDIYFDTEDPMPDIAIGFKKMTELKPLFLKIYNIWTLKKKGYYAKSMSILYEIIEKIINTAYKYNTDASVKKISLSHEYILNHFSDYDFDYKIMCSKSGLSYGYFKKIFIKHYGIPPVKYVTHLRIEKAKELLITKRYSITEIANMCGFENVYYFSNVFKKHTGVSPTDFSIL